ncbi:MAG: short-chain dehydrogenase, partial [bacterium]
LLSDKSAHVTGQIYSVAGTKIAVWNQPEEVRSVYREGGWTAEEIATRLDSTVGQEKMGLLEKLAMYAKAAAAKTKPNA